MSKPLLRDGDGNEIPHARLIIAVAVLCARIVRGSHNNPESPQAADECLLITDNLIKRYLETMEE